MAQQSPIPARAGWRFNTLRRLRAVCDESAVAQRSWWHDGMVSESVIVFVASRVAFEATLAEILQRAANFSTRVGTALPR